VHALRLLHRTLVPGGLALDLQPAPADSLVLAGGDEREFQRRLAATAEGVEQALGEGLFAVEDEVWLDVVHRFPKAAELVAEASGWFGVRVPSAILPRLEVGHAPFEIVETCVLRRLRTR